jgi:DnaD/phage-associated family protein
MRKTSTRKTSTRKTHSLKEESDTKKKQPNNKNQIAAASAAAASQPVSEKGRGKPGPIQEPSTSPENNHLQEDSATPYPPPRPEPVEGAAGPPDNDLAFSQVCRLYQAEIGKMSPLIAEEIRDRLRRCPPAWFEQAISKAAAAEARRWNYIKSILAAWEKCGGPENDHKPTRNGARNGKTSKQPTGNLNPANPDDWQKMLKSVAH